jgi:sugar/nucleoside kinase (ribokinase family)
MTTALPPILISIGDLVVDLITPTRLPILPFNHQETRGLYLEAGGGCNFNILARRLGVDVRPVGAIGADVFGDELRAILTAEGIDLGGVAVLPGSRTCVVLDLIDRETHAHTFVGSLAEGPLVEFTLEMDTLVGTAGAIFAQGYNLHEDQLGTLLWSLLESARQRHIPIYCDTGPTLAHGIEPARIRRLVASCDVLFMTEEEVPLAAAGRSGEEAFAYLFEAGAKAVVVKKGAAGCTVALPGERLLVQGFDVPLVDTVGAGDCFDAAFIYGRLHGLDWRESAELANAAGAASVQKRGSGRNVPTRAEVEAVLGRALPVTD